MASLQVDQATPVEDVITETAEATTKEPQVVPPPPPPPPPPPLPETVKTVDVEDEEDLEDFKAAPYDEKVEASDYEEEKDIEYSPFIERDDEAPFRYAGEPAPTFADFNEDDDDEDYV